MTSSPSSLPAEPVPLPSGESGEALQCAGRFAEAEAAYRARLAKNPNDAVTLSNYGGLLCDVGAFEPALEVLTRAVALAPDLADAWSNLGSTLHSLQRYDEAISAYSRCLRLNPSHAFALSNLGIALDCQGRHEMAQKFHRIAVDQQPESGENHTNYAISLLSQGDYERGFEEYEWRWKVRTTRPHEFDGPLWHGETFEGKTLLIHTEGGFGDMLQFARFIPLVEKRGGHVVVRIRSQLLSLLAYSFPTTRFVTEDEPVPAYDLQCPVLSLPRALGITLASLPSPGGFLKPDPQKIACWAERIRQDIPSGHPLKIGLVWAGAPHSEIREAEIADRRRSTTLATLAPLVQAAPDAVFYSLQVGEQAWQAQTPPAGMRLIDHTDELKDFGDTAALIANLDLVIAVDTSTAHVAAGIGKPVWLLSRYDQCWRWLSGRTDSPWYDSVRIYQQDRPLDWSGPITRMVKDLRELNAHHHKDVMSPAVS